MSKRHQSFRVVGYREIRIQNRSSRWYANGYRFQLFASFPCRIRHIKVLFLQRLEPSFTEKIPGREPLGVFPEVSLTFNQL
jgi:hypothetical protein